MPDEVKRLYKPTAYAIYRGRQARESLDKEGLLIEQGDRLVKNPNGLLLRTKKLF